MATEVKFCGLTRAEDARAATALGARYTGVIFAGGPRRLAPDRAAEVLVDVGNGARRVGVFAAEEPATMADVVARVRLDVVQLHGDPDAAMVERVRRVTGAAVWAVVRIGYATIPPALAALDEAADAIVLDALVAGRLGGTGRRFDWSALAGGKRPRRARLVVAGGLTPENVREAIRVLRPDVVDVSSGVESAPGIKDHARMRAFVEAVRAEPDE